MRRLILLIAFGTVVAACASPPQPTPPATPEVVRATDADGPFTLVLELPKATWTAGESITGQARLSVAKGSGTIYGAAGGPLNFGYKELTGHREMGPASDAACAPHALSVEAPIVVALGKSGGWSDDQPDAAFYRDFLTEPGHPAARWRLARDGNGRVPRRQGLATGPMTTLTAPIELHVTD